CFFPLADLGGKTLATDHIGHLFSVQFLSSVRAAVASSRPACRCGRRAQSAVETGRQANALPLRRRFQAMSPRRRARAAKSGRLGRMTVLPVRLEGAARVQYTPGNTGELVGQRYGKLVVVQPLSCCIDPVLEAVTLPGLRPEQHDARRLHKQLAQIAVSTFG